MGFTYPYPLLPSFSALISEPYKAHLVHHPVAGPAPISLPPNTGSPAAPSDCTAELWGNTGSWERRAVYGRLMLQTDRALPPILMLKLVSSIGVFGGGAFGR